MIRPKKANELTGDPGGPIFELFIVVLSLHNLMELNRPLSMFFHPLKPSWGAFL
jgi:hypothetical protein